jgi:HhH-GPD superfamily base excision DNA repair protein
MNRGVKLSVPRRESAQARRSRAERIAARLEETYPDATCELDFANPWQLLVATILSAQCTDKMVNQVTPALFEQFRDPPALARAPQAKIERMIRKTGFYSQKARAIRACAHDGGTHVTARSGPKNGKRRARYRFRSAGCLRRHPRQAADVPTRSYSFGGSKRDRRKREAAPAREGVDRFLSSADPSWTPGVLRAQSQMRELFLGFGLSADRRLVPGSWKSH